MKSFQTKRKRKLVTLIEKKKRMGYFILIKNNKDLTGNFLYFILLFNT